MKFFKTLVWLNGAKDNSKYFNFLLNSGWLRIALFSYKKTQNSFNGFKSFQESLSYRLWMRSSKGHREVSHVFYLMILFYRGFTKLQVVFYCFKKLKLVFEIWPVKVSANNRFLMAGKKTAKKDYFIKNLSSPTVLKQFFSKLFSIIFTY